MRGNFSLALISVDKTRSVEKISRITFRLIQKRNYKIILFQLMISVKLS